MLPPTSRQGDAPDAKDALPERLHHSKIHSEKGEEITGGTPQVG